MNTQITFEIIDGNLVCPFQDQVEQIALEAEDDIALENTELHRNIYFEPVPLTDKFELMWMEIDGEDGWDGWLLRDKPMIGLANV